MIVACRYAYNIHSYTLKAVTDFLTSAPPAAANPVPSLPSGILPSSSTLASQTEHLPCGLTMVSVQI